MTKSIPKNKSWAILILLSLVSLFFWIKYTYPQLAFVDTSIGRHQALEIAEEHIKTVYPEYTGFQKAIVFRTDKHTDRFLQRTLGFDKMKGFLEKHDYDMFFWLVRLFKENEKEEFLISISSKTGKVIAFKHTIEENAHRPLVEKEKAKSEAIQFLENNYGFDPDPYLMKADITVKYDNREDHTFAWQKKDVNIPWSNEPDSGTGKLIISGKISGNELLSYSKNTFKIPDDFIRKMNKMAETGKNLTAVIRIFYFIIMVGAVFFLLSCHNTLSIHKSKKFYITVGAGLIILSFLQIFNQFQDIAFRLPTTANFSSHIIRTCTNSLIAFIFISMAFIVSGLSGELLFSQSMDIKNKRESLLYYVRSTFFSRNVSFEILLGYFVCLIMLGLQAIIIKFGQQYLGVWTEYGWINEVSSSTLPIFAAFVFALKASLKEEIIYRFFAISWGRKLFNNTIIAAVIASLIWGFAHSSYPVFPMWFRGLEVTCLGLFLSWIFLKYGIIPVIVAHFLFDAFWNCAGFLLGKTQSLQFMTSLALMLLPLGLAIIAYIVNREEHLEPLRWQLNKKQLFNMNVLASYLKNNRQHLKRWQIMTSRMRS